MVHSITSAPGGPQVGTQDIQITLLLPVTEGHIFCMNMSALGVLTHANNSAGGIGKFYAAALESGVAGDSIRGRIKGTVDILVEGLNAAGGDLAVGVNGPITMAATTNNSTGRACVVGDQIIATTGVGQSVGAGDAAVSLKCWIDGINYRGTKHS